MPAYLRFRQSSTIRELHCMILGWYSFPEPDDSRGNQRILKLYLTRVETMNAQQRYLIQQVLLDLPPIIDIHELARNKPACQSVLLHPCMRYAKKITIQARKLTETQTRYLFCQFLQPQFFTTRQMMMPDIWRVTDKQVGFLILSLWG